MLDLSISDFSVLGFGGLFCLVWAAGLSLQLPIRTKFIAVYFVGISGFRLVWEAFTLSGFVYRYPEIYSLPVPFLYLIGPSILFYYEKLSGVENWKMSYSHFIPVVFAFLPLLYWTGLNSEQKLLSVQSILNGNWKYPYGIYILWIIGPKISILVYTLFIAFRQSGEGALAIQLLPEKIRIFSITLLVYILIMIIADILGYVLGNKFLYRYSAWSHSFAAIFVYLYSRLNPHSMLEISGAIKTARYSRSKLINLNSNEAILKLNHLMGNESYYADEDLRLSTLADAMQMSSHQLSELINVHYQMSFIHFVNSHRIKIACKMLEEEKRNILSIAYSVGFNSKSAFNRVFRQCMGNSPREYRKNPHHFKKEKSMLIKKIEPRL